MEFLPGRHWRGRHQEYQEQLLPGGLEPPEPPTDSSSLPSNRSEHQSETGREGGNSYVCLSYPWGNRSHSLSAEPLRKKFVTSICHLLTPQRDRRWRGQGSLSSLGWEVGGTREEPDWFFTLLGKKPGHVIWCVSFTWNPLGGM